MKKLFYYLLFSLGTILLTFIACEKSSFEIDEQTINIEQTENLLSPLKKYNLDIKQGTSMKSPNANVVTKSFILRGSGTMSFNFNSPDCFLEAGQYIQTVVQGKGHATHLGLFTIEIKYCTDGINPVTLITGTQTAANGDELFTMLVGAGEDENGFWQNWIYNGGTGRFENAIGSIKLYTTIDYVNLVYSNYGVGELAY